MGGIWDERRTNLQNSSGRNIGNHIKSGSEIQRTGGTGFFGQSRRIDISINVDHTKYL